MTRIAILLLVLMVCSSVASLRAQEETGGTGDVNEKVCINSRSANSFDAFTDQHVYVGAVGDKHYLLTMKNRCNGLRFAKGIALRDTTSRVCSDGFGEIVYRDMGRLASCRIGIIESVASKDDARAIVEQRQEEAE